MKVPDEIKKVERPRNTVVEARVNTKGIPTYIVRERNGSVYSNGRSRPRNGCVIGYIIDRKYVPKPSSGPIEPEERSMTTWAVERLIIDLTPDVLEDLMSAYDLKNSQTLYSMAILKVRNPDLRNSRMKRDYDESILALTYPNLAMSKNSVSDLLKDVGSVGLRLQQFIECRCKRLPEGAHLAVDGTLITDNSIVNNLSAVSRKTRVRGNREISLIYAYDIERGEPVCFSAYPGNMLDSKAYSDFIRTNDLRNALLIGDKAFTENAAREEFKDRPDLHFLHPVRRNAGVICRFHLHDYNNVLRTYPGITYCVFNDTEHNIHYYAFRDAERAMEEERAFIEKMKGKAIDPEKIRKLRDRWGTIIYQSDLDMKPEDVYRAYSFRWRIEQMFNLYKNVENFDDTNVQNDESVIGEHFVNFIATVMTSRLMNRFLEAELLDKMTFGEVMNVLRRGLKFKDKEGEWIFRAQTEKEKEVLRALDLMPKLPPKRGPGRPRKNA